MKDSLECFDGLEGLKELIKYNDRLNGPLTFSADLIGQLRPLLPEFIRDLSIDLKKLTYDKLIRVAQAIERFEQDRGFAR